jgi:hypothetical protein
MPRPDTPIEVALKGAAAGLGGTFVLTAAMAATAGLLERRAGELPNPESPFTPPAAALPARLISRIARGLFERELSPETENALGHGLHWTYGAFWGIVYGIVQASVHLPAPLHGTVLGLIAWLVGPLGLAPALGLVDVESGREPPRLLRSLLFHQVYGWAVALAFGLLSRDD